MSTLKIHSYKKNSTSPTLRFKGFNDEWKQAKLVSLLKNYRLGGNYENSEAETGTPLIKMGNLGRGNIVLDKVQYVQSNEILDEKDRIEFGDLFFNTRNTLDLVGKVAIWRNELPTAYYNSNLMHLKFEDNFFMNYRLNSFQGIKSLRRLATGTTSVAAIYTKDLLHVKFFVPSLAEQQKIASFLSAVDEKIQQLTRKNELLEQYKKGVMQQLFSGKLRFKDENGKAYAKWEEKRLGELLTIQSGNTPSNSVFDEDGAYPFFKVEELNNSEKYQTKSRFYSNEGKDLIKKNSIVFPKRGAAIMNNKVRITKVDSFIDTNLMALTPKSEALHYEFLYYKIFEVKLYKIADSSTIPQINNKHIEPFKIWLPSLSEQQKIASFLTGLDSKIESVATQIAHTQTFKKGLLQQMFV